MPIIQLDFKGDVGAIELQAKRVRIQLQRLVEKVDPELLEALIEGAKFIKIMAKGYVRVKTGSCQKSIRVERQPPTTVRVRAGGYITNPETGRKVDYAGHLEKRYPYMKPAWTHGQPFVSRQVDAAMERLASG